MIHFTPPSPFSSHASPRSPPVSQLLPASLHLKCICVLSSSSLHLCLLYIHLSAEPPFLFCSFILIEREIININASLFAPSLFYPLPSPLQLISFLLFSLFIPPYIFIPFSPSSFHLSPAPLSCPSLFPRPLSSQLFSIHPLL